MEVPEIVKEAVFKSSKDLPEGVNSHVKGYDFNKGLDYDALMASFATTGFQATHFADAVNVLNELIALRKRSFIEYPTCDRPCKIFLAYTSNMVSSGVREIIRFLCQHNLVDVIVSTAGGVEEDLIKCLNPFYMGSFNRWRGEELRARGINRIGNILVPNNNYVEFEKWLTPILDQMLEQQKAGFSWTPSKVIDKLGAEINDDNSIYFWCHKNQIPVFCPALTDGSLGDQIFGHSYKAGALKVDIVADLREINHLAIFAKHTGMLVLGAGLVKHHTFNANLMRNGADFCIMINTAQEFDGSDAGATPDEAISWGKIRGGAKYIKVHADASLIFPLLVAQTFVKHHFSKL